MVRRVADGDAQRVIVMCSTRIAAGGAKAELECRRMVSEKIAAGAAARAAAAKALASGKGVEVAAAAAVAQTVVRLAQAVNGVPSTSLKRSRRSADADRTCRYHLRS
jgi:hypothetical protein